jgi:phosphoribosylanthranilate isomerase
MFRIKICGITNIADARVAARAGADAVGLNFFSKSRRFVKPEDAQTIAAALPPGVLRVGVFVNEQADVIAHVVRCVGLDAVQLHGDEPPELMTRLPADVRVIRAHRCDRAGLLGLANYLHECSTLGKMPDAVLVDAHAPEHFGGSGQLADWALIDRDRGALAGMPLILAGGLTPDNVAAAILAVRPQAVDAASGVEREPGHKDPALVARFVDSAREALARIE